MEIDIGSSGCKERRLTQVAFSSGVIGVVRKTRRVSFTIGGEKYSFYILESEGAQEQFDKCVEAVKEVVDPVRVQELRAGRSPPHPGYSPSSSEQSSPSATPPPLASADSSPSTSIAQAHNSSQARTAHVPSSVASHSPNTQSHPQATPRSQTLPASGASAATSRQLLPANSATSTSAHQASPHAPLSAAGVHISSSQPLMSASLPSTPASGRRSEYFLTVEVKTPLQEGDVVTYLVTHRTNLKEYPTQSGEVRRRYSQFEALHTALTNRFAKLVAVPSLPSKPWFKKFDAAFLDQRKNDLNTWLQGVALDEYMYRAPELVVFLTDQAPVSVSGPTGYVGKLIQPLMDNPVVLNIGDAINGTVATVMQKTGGNVATGSALSSSNGMILGSPLERDYHQARTLMEMWKLTPKKLPFPKFVTLLLGSTSSGKSAFVNHHFGCVARKSTDHQQDTDFTVVEVIPPNEFYQLSGTTERIVHKSQAMLYPDAQVVDEKLLKAPIEAYESDWRRGRVFIRLNSAQMLTRYEQLRPYAKEGLFSACLINEACLDRSAPHFDLACNSILIDSPGFSTIQSAEIAEKFRGTLVVLQYLYNMCDLLLYFVPCGQISTLAQHLPMLELALTYASHGEKIGDEALKTLFSRQVQEANNSGSGFLTSFCSAIASSIIKQATSGYASPSSGPVPDTGQGASVWHKTLFILSKVDILFRQKDPSNWSRVLLSQYYELGVLLGSSLSLLVPPVHDQCLTIGLPQYIHAGSYSRASTPVPVTADLDLLTAKMAGREREAPYISRLEMAIQQMCSDLEKAMAGSFMTMGQHQTMLDLRSRSEARNRSRQTGLIHNN